MAATLTLNLLIDKERNRVVFAESDNRFVDILLSFLTLPMATIVRLLNKNSSLGSLDRLYKSVEELDPQFFQTEACKSMLLLPRSVAGVQCDGLAINVDDSDHGVYYKCSKCCRARSRGVSSVRGVWCPCGGAMDSPVRPWCAGSEKGLDGVFVKAEGRFIVSDDLMVRLASTGESLGLLRRLRIEDGSVLEKRTVDLGEAEILRLLKRSLISKMPLTDVFLQETDIIDVEEKSVVTDITQARVKHKRAAVDSKRINLKLYLSSDHDKVVYAEAGEDLADLLFSFLTFPLGSITKLLPKHSSMGCIENLYDSVELLSSDFAYMKSEEVKNMLLSPLLPTHFGCRHQLLSIGEMSPQMIRTYDEVNPKQQKSSSGTGEGYARGMVKFMVTDGLEVTPLSPISGFHIINKLMVPISSLEEAEASLGEAEALSLLKACLFSHTVLSDVFSPYLLTLLQENWCGRLPRKCNGFLD